MWGKVVEHEFGYRAEFAQVESLLLPKMGNCQKASHDAEPEDLRVFIEARPLDPFVACSACMKQLFECAGTYEFWWQSLTYIQVLSQLAETYGVPLIRDVKKDRSDALIPAKIPLSN